MLSDGPDRLQVGASDELQASEVPAEGSEDEGSRTEPVFGPGMTETGSDV